MWLLDEQKKTKKVDLTIRQRVPVQYLINIYYHNFIVILHVRWINWNKRRRCKGTRERSDQRYITTERTDTAGTPATLTNNAWLFPLGVYPPPSERARASRPPFKLLSTERVPNRTFYDRIRTESHCLATIINNIIFIRSINCIQTVTPLTSYCAIQVRFT